MARLSRRRRDRRRAVALVLLVAAVATVVFLVSRDGGDGDGGGGDEVVRLLPGDLPKGFEVLEVRTLPSGSPFAGSTQVGLRLFGARKGSDPLGGGDLGVVAVRSAGVPDAASFSPEHEEVKVGETTAYRSEVEVGSKPLAVLAWDVEPAGTVALVGSRSLDGAALEKLVGKVTAGEAATATPIPTLAEAAAPSGFVEVASGDGSFALAGTPPADARGYEVDYIDRTNPSRRLLVSRWTAEVEWEVMLRWWVGSPGRKVRVDGKNAVVVTLGSGGGFESNLVGWRDGDATLLVIGSGVGTGTLLDIAAGLRPVSEEEWARLPVPGGGFSGVPPPQTPATAPPPR